MTRSIGTDAGTPRRTGHTGRSGPRGLRAYTLLELLVVVGIIALLAAIMLPSLGRARQQSRRVACQSQVRQLMVGWHQYLDANRGRFPRGLDMNIQYGGKEGLLKTAKGPKPLNLYLRLPGTMQSGAEVFRCPMDRDGDGKDIYPTYFDYYGTSYRANRILIGPEELPVSPLDPCKALMEDINSRLGKLNRSGLGNESRLVVLGDFGWEDVWNIASTERADWHGQPDWHNIGFLDGHADYLQIGKGISVSPRYVVIPFRTMIPAMVECQNNGK